MKRPSSAPRGYLHQLAAPLPRAAVLLHARRPVARGAGTVLDAIPPVVDSVDSSATVEAFADHGGAPDSPVEASNPRNASVQRPRDPSPNVVSSVRSASPPSDAQREATSLRAAPASTSAQPIPVSSHGEDIPQPAAPRSSVRKRSTPTGEAAPQRLTRLDPEPARQLSTSMLRPSHAESSSPLHASPSASADGESTRNRDKRSRGVEVRIGTVEVRIAAPPSLPPPPAANRHRDPIPSHTGRPAHAEPLSRGLAWSHGLVQG